MQFEARPQNPMQQVQMLLFAALISGGFIALTVESWTYGFKVAALLFGIGLIPRIRAVASFAGLIVLVWSLAPGLESLIKAWHKSPWSPFVIVPAAIVIALACFAVLQWCYLINLEWCWFRNRKAKTHKPPTTIDEEPSFTKERSEYECFSLLGINPKAGIDEIKRAYRERVKQYHPDRVAGLGKELQELATRKTIELRSAQDQALLLAANRS